MLCCYSYTININIPIGLHLTRNEILILLKAIKNKTAGILTIENKPYGVDVYFRCAIQ
jgi:hypothetical protein